MKLEVAEMVAGTFISEIKGFCERIEVAGSVRRMKPEVNDIEIVAVPFFSGESPRDLFGNIIYKDYLPVNTLHSHLLVMKNSLDIKLDRISKDGKKAPFGPRYYRLTYRDTPVDLFCVLPPARWPIIFTIRTGPAEFSHWLVTRALEQGMKVRDGQLWFDRDGRLGPEVFVTSERDFFDKLKVPWMEPHERQVPALKVVF